MIALDFEGYRNLRDDPHWQFGHAMGGYTMHMTTALEDMRKGYRVAALAQLIAADYCLCQAIGWASR